MGQVHGRSIATIRVQMVPSGSRTASYILRTIIVRLAQVKKNLDGYFPSSTTPRQPAYTAKQPRVKARKPRSASYTAFQDKTPAAQRRSSVGKASKKGLRCTAFTLTLSAATLGSIVWTYSLRCICMSKRLSLARQPIERRPGLEIDSVQGPIKLGALAASASAIRFASARPSADSFHAERC